MEEDSVEPPGPKGRGRSSVTALPADLAGPAAAAGEVLQNGEFDALGGGEGTGDASFEKL